MADWSKPALASAYANFVVETNGRDTDLAVMFDPAVVTPTNFPTNAVRWRAAANKWEKWNGTVWSDLAATYAINISGTASNITGVVAAANGGSGQSSYTVGDLLYASGAEALSKLASVATGNVLRSGGVATAPSWGKVALTTDVSGVLPVANGGTGGTLPVANGGTGATSITGFVYGNGTGAFTAASAAQIGALGFPAGTKMPFAQAAAPTGWTQDTTDSATNRMLRVVNTAGGGVGGSSSPILNNVVPAHTHGFSTGTVSADHAHSGSTGGRSAAHTHTTTVTYKDSSSLSNPSFVVGGKSTDPYGSITASHASGTESADHAHGFTAWGISANHTHAGTTDNGSSQTNWAPRYIDMIICTKD